MIAFRLKNKESHGKVSQVKIYLRSVQKGEDKMIFGTKLFNQYLVHEEG